MSRELPVQFLFRMTSSNAVIAIPGRHSGGAKPQKSLRIVRRISSGNRISSERIMRAETPIPPIRIGAAAPDGVPPRRSNPVYFFSFKAFSSHSD
jgi:hypothetical protein